MGFKSRVAKIKKCPFCGGQPFLVKGFKMFWIKCVCGVSGSVSLKADAIKAWNRRV